MFSNDNLVKNIKMELWPWPWPLCILFALKWAYYESLYARTFGELSYEPILTGLEAISSGNQCLVRHCAAFFNFCLIFSLKGKKYTFRYQIWVFLCYFAYFGILWKNEAKIKKSGSIALEALISWRNCFKSRQNRFIT